MEEKNSQENDIETIEPIKPDTKIDINSPSSETESDIPSRLKQHKENIDKLIVPQYTDDQYAVTYSVQDNSIIGWIEENEQHQPDAYFKLDQNYDIESFALYKKTLIFGYYDDKDDCKYLF